MKTNNLATILCLMAFLTLAQTVAAQQDVTVVNPRNNPVKVRDVDNPAKQPYSVSMSINPATFPSVPAGKTFVVEHISGSLRLGSAFNSSPCRINQLSFSVGSTIDVIPVYMGTGQGLSNDVNFFSFSQPVRAYVTGGSDIGGASYVLAPSCSFQLTGASSNIVFTGHLDNAN